MEKILVTGATGYIGSHVVVELLRNDYEVLGADNFSNSKRDVVDKIKQISGKEFSFEEVNLNNLFETKRMMAANTDIDAIIHCAGSKSITESLEYPSDYYFNNIVSSVNIVKAMQQFGCKRIVFSSTAAVYGNGNPPYKENDKINPQTPYAYTKSVSENLLQDVCKSDKDFSAVILRYFNPVGADGSGLIGDTPIKNPTNLVPYVVRVATGVYNQLKIYGDDYETKDGTGERDYIHVSDVARAHINAIKYSFQNKGYEVFNIGTGKCHSVYEILHAIEDISNKKLPFTIKPRRKGDAAISYADNKKAIEKLNFKTEHDFEKMCIDSYNFAVKNTLK